MEPGVAMALIFPAGAPVWLIFSGSKPKVNVGAARPDYAHCGTDVVLQQDHITRQDSTAGSLPPEGVPAACEAVSISGDGGRRNALQSRLGSTYVILIASLGSVIFGPMPSPGFNLIQDALVKGCWRPDNID